MALKIAVLGMCSGHTSDLKCVKFVVKPPVNFVRCLGEGKLSKRRKGEKFCIFFWQGLCLTWGISALSALSKSALALGCMRASRRLANAYQL